MEQLKPYLTGIWRNRFWIACGLLAVVSLATWFLASNSVNAERDDNIMKLDAKKLAINSVLNTEAQLVNDQNAANPVSVHPNQLTNDGMEVQIRQAAQVALDAWRIRWEQQKDLLDFAPELPEHLRTRLAEHNPPETLPLDQKDPIPVPVRQTFMEHIPKRMPVLAKIVGTTWKHDESEEKEKVASGAPRPSAPPLGGAGPSGGSLSLTQAPVTEDIVIWEEKNQDLWNDKLTVFSGRHNNESATGEASTHQMLALQQDLWMLEAVFDIIKEVNGDAEANDLAAIKKIDHVLVGQDAFQGDEAELHPINLEVRVQKKQAATFGSGASGISPPKQRYTAATPTVKGRAEAAAAKEFNPESSKSPFHGRYVDRNYQQLADDDVANVLNSKTLTERSYLSVAKRVPIRVGLIMDERKIGDFLAAAANSPFNFEVRMVRMNRHEPGGGAEITASNLSGAGQYGGLARGGGPGAGGGMTADDDASTGGSSSSGSVSGPAGSVGGPAEQRTHFDINIEFAGIVKMYNPVDATLFGPQVPDNTASTTVGPSSGQ